eukprot:2397235-Prymnesium_polylepis.1
MAEAIAPPCHRRIRSDVSSGESRRGVRCSPLRGKRVRARGDTCAVDRTLDAARRVVTLHRSGPEVTAAPRRAGAARLLSHLQEVAPRSIRRLEHRIEAEQLL